MEWDVKVNVVEAAGIILSVIGGGWALLMYRNAARTRRAEWLASLHENFFETDRYADIRRVLDYWNEPEYADRYSTLKTAVTNQKPGRLADDLYRYLNFFEFLMNLEQLQQISAEEINALFRYDLEQIPRHHSFILDALGPQDFEGLDRWYRSKQGSHIRSR